MPDINVAAGEVSSGRFNLAAGQVSTVTFTDNITAVQITSDGTAAVYYTTDGRTPAIDARIAYEIPAGVLVAGEKATKNPASPFSTDVVKIISAGTPSVRVERDD